MFSFFPIYDESYQKGIDEGFRIAESHFAQWLKEMSHELKARVLESRATSTFTSDLTHKCNCKFCRVDKKKIEI